MSSSIFPLLGTLLHLQVQEWAFRAADILLGESLTLIHDSAAVVEGVDELCTAGFVIAVFIEAVLNSTLWGEETLGCHVDPRVVEWWVAYGSGKAWRVGSKSLFKSNGLHK